MESFLQILGGLLLLFLGGETLVRGSCGIAKKLEIPPFIIGLTIVAYGTSSPELFISIQAASKGYSGIAIGNAIGSNISNILCVLGLSSMVYPIAINRKELLNNTVMMFWITVLTFVFCIYGTIGFFQGTIFLLILFVSTVRIFRVPRDTDASEEEGILKNSFILSLGLLLFGLAALITGSDLLVEGAVSVATSFGLSEDVIGVTIVAFGGSTPELATSLIAAFRKQSDIAIGSILGSNIFNILGVLGASALVADMKVSREFLVVDLPFLLVISGIFLLFIMKMKTFSRLTGSCFFVFYILYTFLKLYS